MKSPGRLSVPLNIRCSNRWAKPVLPFGSSFEPTLYQTLTAAIGALWSSWTMTVRPLLSLKLVCGIDTCLTSVGIGTDCAGAAIAGGVRMVAAASSAIQLGLCIGLNLRSKFRCDKRATLAPQPASATATEPLFDQRMARAQAGANFSARP